MRSLGGYEGLFDRVAYGITAGFYQKYGYKTHFDE